MNRIKILSKSLTNFVSAGEVVEGPFSVVKELVENSIDALSNKIFIKIKSGGTKLINVIDNGCGIQREDVEIAFLNHATSKIKCKEDIEKISSLGFRGEALSSISSVSKVEINTKSKYDKIGTRLKLISNSFIEKTDFAMQVGTSMIIKDLFFNTPARLKFLKRNSSEGSFVTYIIEKLALSHPEISFTFVKDDKEILRTYGDNNIKSVVSIILGKDFIKKSVELNYKINDIEISGFVGLTSNAKASKKYQFVFLNGRYVKIPIVSDALEECFRNDLPNGRFVPCVIYIKMAFESVDVNVSPSKNIVRFLDEKSIFEAIFFAVKNSLKNYKYKNFIEFNEEKYDLDKSIFYNENNEKNINLIKKLDLNSSVENLNYDNNVDIKGKKYKDIDVNLDNNLNNFKEKIKFKLKNDNKINNFENTKIYETDFFIKIIGEIFNCYLLAELNNEIIIIDKHAAHERIIYEHIKSKDKNSNSQNLINPIIKKLNKIEYDIIKLNKKVFLDLGYEIDEFNDEKIIIRSIPVYLEIGDASESISEIISYLIKNKKNFNIESLNLIYSKIACKSAIKAGKLSNFSQINLLIKHIFNSSIKHCPHGRPIFVYIKKSEFDKYFFR